MRMQQSELKEQHAGLDRIPARASATTNPPVHRQQQSSSHRAGSTFGLHDESAPYTTAHRQTNVTQTHADDYYAGYDMPRPASSTRRYRPTQAVTKVTEAVPHARSITIKGLLLAISLVLLAGTLIAFLLTAYIAPAIKNYNDTQAYGNPPRIYKMRANTGHGTKTNPDSQYIGINNGGAIEVVELPTGIADASVQPHLYTIAHLTGVDATTTPITNISFVDINGDGKLDMEVTVHDTLYIRLNNGNTFVAQQ
jgi:hypothetical protein